MNGVLTCNGASLRRLAALAIVIGDIAALKQKPRKYPMEGRVLVTILGVVHTEVAEIETR